MSMLAHISTEALDEYFCKMKGKHMIVESDLVTGVEAAEILGVDDSTVSRWSDDRLQPEARKLTAVIRLRGPRGIKLYRRADVETLRDERAAAEPAGARSA